MGPFSYKEPYRESFFRCKKLKEARPGNPSWLALMLSTHVFKSAFQITLRLRKQPSTFEQSVLSSWLVAKAAHAT